jgi:TfoX/Sxy family transcriptional regulator of competence genes
MVYDPALAERVRQYVMAEPGVDERKMFGGVIWMINGNMACGVTKDSLIVRMDIEDYEASLALPGADVFDMTGKVMKRWVLVDSAVLESGEDLANWIDKGTEFANSLPPK